MSGQSKKVAICHSGTKTHSTNWTNAWVAYCEEMGVPYAVLDGYTSHIIEELSAYDCLLWHFSGYIFQDMLMARNVLFSAEKMGLKVFPGFNESWHFDDKIAETYILQSIRSPIPDSYMFYSRESALQWLNEDPPIPIVAKLRNGSGAHNVKLLNSKEELRKYIDVMFTKGINSTPSLIFKTTSNVKSVKSLKQLFARAKRIPEFLKTFRRSQEFSKERGYVFFQEYIPNDGFDLKVVVVGDKLSFIARNVREGDFRASGGGDLFFDRGLVSKDILESAFMISDKLGFHCMGYDYVVDRRSGKGKVVEISYGFSHEALLEAGGYFDRQGNWHSEPLNAPTEVLKNLLEER